MDKYIIRVGDPIDTDFPMATMYSPQVAKEANMKLTNPPTGTVDENLKAIATLVTEEGLQFPSKRAISNAKRHIAKIATADLVTRHDLQFVHIRRLMDAPYVASSDRGIDPKGGMTIAYRVLHKGGKVIEMSTSLCNPKDVYDKILGKAGAALNYDAGRKVTLRLKETKYGQTLKHLFEYVV